MANEIYLLCAVVVAIVSSARLTRLLVQDVFPPVMWVRNKWDEWTETGWFENWNKLFHCHWCMSIWVTTAIVLWGWLSNWHISWWLVNGIIAMSYVAAMIVERDEKE